MESICYREVVTYPHQVRDLQPSWCEKNETLYNLFSIIVFPVGVVRLVQYVVNKYLLTTAILRYYKNKDLPCLNIPYNQWTEPQNGLAATLCRIETPNKRKVRVLKIAHCNRPTNKWMLFCLGSSQVLESKFPTLLYMAKELGYNIISYNYQGMRGSTTTPPSSIEDLADGGEGVLQHLFNQGIPPKDIVINGFSLGGAVALELGSRYQEDGYEIPVVVQNSFNNIDGFVDGIVEEGLPFFLNKRWEHLQLKRLETRASMQIAFSLLDILLTPIRLAYRISLFAIYLFADIITCNFFRFKHDLYEIIRTVWYEATLLTLNIVALPLTPFTKQIHHLIIDTIYENYIPKGTPPTIKRLLHMPIIKKIPGIILRFCGWHMENIKNWEKIKTGYKFCITAPKDRVMHFDRGSLYSGLRKKRLITERGVDYTLLSHPDHYHSSILPSSTEEIATQELKNFLKKFDQ